MELLLVIVGAFAVWRFTYMIQEESGPFEIFRKLQAWYWTDPRRAGGLKEGLRCFNCTSVWFSALAALIIAGNVWVFFLYWFAIAAGAMFVNKAFDKE